MKPKKTIITALYKPIKTIIFPSADEIRITLNKIPRIKLTSIKTPVEMLNEMPALKIEKNDFYANAKIKLKVNTIFATASTKEILSKQSEFMKQIIEETKSDIRKKTMENYHQSANHSNKQ